jgi:hypothetical protein
MSRAIAFLLLMAASASAAEVRLTGTEITAALAGKTLYAGPSAEIEQIFQSTGLTMYTDKGAMSQGTWKVDGDKYCSQWPPSNNWSCYEVTRDGSTITFIGAGNRYPMRIEK